MQEGGLLQRLLDLWLLDGRVQLLQHLRKSIVLALFRQHKTLLTESEYITRRQLAKDNGISSHISAWKMDLTILEKEIHH